MIANRDYRPTTLKLLRRDRGLTQIELAVYCGTSQPMISMWENGQLSPSPEQLTRIGELFKIDPPYERLLERVAIGDLTQES